MTQQTQTPAAQMEHPAPVAPSAPPPQLRLDLFDNSKFDRGRPRWVEALWILAKCFFFATPFPWPNKLKRVLLRMFGASVGKGVIIRPGVSVHFPWRLKVGDHCWIGDSCVLLSIAPITFEDHVALAHEVYVAAGGHDIRSATMAGQHAPVLVKTGTWIASRAFVGPGVTIHERVVVGAGAVVMKDVGPDVVVAGNPAKVIRPRVIDRP
jgi:putative colanic acid biosynthesis acetyltransferase WcaF